MLDPAHKPVSPQRARLGNATDQDRFLRLPEVVNRTGLPRSSLYRAIKANKFPAPIPLLSTRVVVWLSSQVTEWMDEQIASHRTKTQ